jgi:hypothetical protein
MVTDTARKPTHTYLYVLLVIIFAVSRLIAYGLGVRYDASPMHWFFQILDPVYLQTRLWQSLFYLHSQPPGFNFFIGVILNTVPRFEFLAFRTVYLVTGLFMVLGLFYILEKLKIPRYVSVPTTILFIVCPPAILFENWLFYTYPTALMLLTSGIFLYLYFERHTWPPLALFFITLGAIIATRSLFTIPWFLFIFIGVLLHDRKNSKSIVSCALLPFLFIVCLHLKNQLVFQQPTLSSWVGMSLIKMVSTVPQEKIEAHIEHGDIPAIARIPPFGTPDEYRAFAVFDTTTGIPVLDTPYKSTDFPNYNHIGYVSVSRQYLHAARFLIRKYPAYYGLSVVKACYAYLRPTSDSIIFSGNNRERLNAWITLYQNYLLGDVLKHVWQTTYTNRYGHQRVVHINFLYVYIPILYVWSFMCALRPGKVQADKAGAVFLQFIAFTIAYVTAAGNLIDVSENMRFRFLLVPFTYILLALLVSTLTKKR